MPTAVAPCPLSLSLFPKFMPTGGGSLRKHPPPIPLTIPSFCFSLPSSALLSSLRVVESFFGAALNRCTGYCIFEEQAPKPSSGPHKSREFLPLILILRNRLKYALTYREVIAILMQRHVLVDGKVRTDKKYPSGFMGMFEEIALVLVTGFLVWAYRAACPPPPRICGSPGGPPITAPRIKLRDGRYLAYKEHGVPKEMAKYKIVCVHGFGSSRLDVAIVTSGMVEELGVYFVSFDRPGYGESDPDPKRTLKSIALDIEELADQLELGSKFYVIGVSMGGQVVWGCLEYIPHRLAGATLIAPVINYWWPRFPTNLSAEAYYQQFPQDQWALRVAHYIPWLTYWWNTQKWFPPSSVIAQKAKFSRQDLEIISKLSERQNYREYATQQGEFESFHRDMKIGFGSWEFDPMDLKNPFLDGEGSVHLWQGNEDGLVPVTLQRYIAERLPWIHYHEVTGAGHLLPFADGMKDAILKALLLGEKSLWQR